MRYLQTDELAGTWDHMSSAIQDIMDAIGGFFERLHDAIIKAVSRIAAILLRDEGLYSSGFYCRWCAELLILTPAHVCSRCGGPPKTWTPEYVFAGQ